MVILKSQTHVELTLPPLVISVRGVQNTQDHFMGPHWTKVLPGSVPRISERHVRPQATNAHLGRPRFRSRPNHKPCHTPSRAPPHEHIRTVKDHELAPQGWRGRALDVPQASIESHRHDTSHKHTHSARAPKCGRFVKCSAHHRAHLREKASEPPRIVYWLQRAGARERWRHRCRVLEEDCSTSKSNIDL